MGRPGTNEPEWSRYGYRSKADFDRIQGTGPFGGSENLLDWIGDEIAEELHPGRTRNPSPTGSYSAGFTKMAGELVGEGAAQVRASLEKEAAGGGAWNDPSWPYRLRGHLLRSDYARTQAGNPELTSDAHQDITGWDKAFLRREWIRYFLGSAGESL